MKRSIIVVLLLMAPVLNAAVHTEMVTYKHGGAMLEGYLAYDDAIKVRRPGVLIGHEWMGLNDYAKKRAEQLAQMGYVAFALDVYGKGQNPIDAEGAGKLSGFYTSDRTLLRGRANAGLKVLKNQPLVDPKKIAAIGYCFGGTTVLELARSGADVVGAVSFHGGLSTPNPADAKKIRGRVLVLHGADDPYVPDTEVAAFEDEMRKAKVDWELIKYSGAVHGFTNPSGGKDPSKGYAYNEKADKRSWAAMKQFFDEIFSGKH